MLSFPRQREIVGDSRPTTTRFGPGLEAGVNVLAAVPRNREVRTAPDEEAARSRGLRRTQGSPGLR